MSDTKNQVLLTLDSLEIDSESGTKISDHESIHYDGRH